MTDSKPAVSTNDLGVVDPIRIPGGAKARRLWANLPLLSRVFVALVAVDVVVRALGLFGTSLFLELALPWTLITSFLPHDALILLPALIAARRPGVLHEMPLLVRGTIIVALVELLKDPLGNLASGISVDQFVAPVLVGMAGAIATAVGWIFIARGMSLFTPSTPPDQVEGLSGFVAGGLAIGAVVAAIGSILLGNPDLGDPGWDALLRLNNAVVALSGLGVAYLAWIIVRGTVDPNRPAVATKLATISLAGVVVGTILLWFGGQGPIWIGAFLLTHNAAWTGLVVAFGLGLADPSASPRDGVEAEPDDGPSWPEPGDPSSWPRTDHRPSA